jgi:hypothetical protein
LISCSYLACNMWVPPIHTKRHVLSSGGLLTTAAQADICGFNLVLEARGLVILRASSLQFNVMQLHESSYPRDQQAVVYRRAARKVAV